MRKVHFSIILTYILLYLRLFDSGEGQAKAQEGRSEDLFERNSPKPKLVYIRLAPFARNHHSLVLF